MTFQVIKIIKRAASLMAIAIFAAAALGQSNTGTITGVVADQNGAVVANATVTVTNMGTNESRTTTTDSNGFYRVTSLANGTYKVAATASGFRESTVSDARLAVGETLRLDVTVGVAEVAATVTVAGETPTNTETSTVGDTIAIERIADNPVNGRDFTGLLATIPGSVQTSHQFNTSINGIPSTFGGSSVLVDGIDAGRVDLNGTSNVLGRIESRINRVSMDSIQEIQVVEQNYSAQYGQALGAVINPITKSGTNEFHGSVFEYFRHESLDANDFFNNAAGFPRSKFLLNQFGANVSGPIKRDKLFFFANYEGVRQTRGQLFTALTPTAAFRAAVAASPVSDLVATLPLPTTPLIDPDTGLPDPFRGIFQIQKNGKLREDTGSVKIDWLHTDKSSFAARYNINDSKTETPYGVGTDQTADGTLTVQLFKFSHNYTISSNMINEAAFGINHNKTHPDGGPSPFPIVGFLFGDQGTANIGPAQFNQRRTGVVYHFLDTLTFVKGDHALKGGIDIRLNRRSAESFVQETLQYVGIVDPSTLDLLNNLPFAVSRSGHPELEFANENFSFFIQDDWKAHPRLSLNLGLRYDVSTVSREKNGLLQNFDPDTLTFSPVGEKVHNMDTNNWGPRLGFAFDVFGNQKTVLRGGYGIFYNRELPASWGSPHVNTFPTQSVNFFEWLGCLFGGNTTVNFAFPIDPQLYEDCAVPSAFAIDRDLKTGKAQHWSLNVQQDLGFGTLQVGYVGNHVSDILTDGVVTPININRNIEGRPLSPDFGDVFLVGNYPSSNYHAMQVTFRRNFAKGLRFNANYTWSHTVDDVVGFFRDYQNSNDPEAERASSDQDVRHNFTLDAGYDLPIGEWWDSGPKWLTSGWNLSTITQIRSGLPVNVTLSGGVFGGFSGRPDIVPGVDPYAPSNARCSGFSIPDCQFNPDAFIQPQNGPYGNAGRNILRGPNFAQVDFSVFKNTRFSESMALQLRVDMFNIFNRANFADPSGGLSPGDANSTRPTAFFGRSVSSVGNQLGGLLGFGGPRQIQLSARFNF
jgi:hypothetical protein